VAGGKKDGRKINNLQQQKRQNQIDENTKMKMILFLDG
jgi:hypothetical protein